MYLQFLNTLLFLMLTLFGFITVIRGYRTVIAMLSFFSWVSSVLGLFKVALWIFITLSLFVVAILCLFSNGYLLNLEVLQYIGEHYKISMLYGKYLFLVVWVVYFILEIILTFSFFKLYRWLKTPSFCRFGSFFWFGIHYPNSFLKTIWYTLVCLLLFIFGAYLCYVVVLVGFNICNVGGKLKNWPQIICRKCKLGVHWGSPTFLGGSIQVPISMEIFYWVQGES